MLAASVMVMLAAATADAYPQYVGRGEFNCSDCHYSPTGGGLINDWGRVWREATFFGRTAHWPGHAKVTGYAGDASAFQFDVGADGRGLPMLAKMGSGVEAVFFPMLAEVGGVGAYGPAMVYATVAARKSPPSGIAVEPFSREHWMKFAVGDEFSVRAGRMVLPFGIRIADHTQYVREDFGFDQWGQSYAVELDWVSDTLSVSAAGFAGDFLSTVSDRRESGGVVRGSLVIAERGMIGVSALGGTSTARDRIAGSLFGSVNLFTDGYVLAELAAQHVSAGRTDQALTTTAGYLRVGWFVDAALDVYAEFGHRRLSSHDLLDKTRYALGTNWQVTHWFEFGPQLMLEDVGDAGAQWFAMGQLHLMY